MLKYIDRVQKGKKILVASGLYAFIKTYLMTYGIDLAEYELLTVEIANLVDALYVASIALFRVAQEDFRGNLS